MSSDTASHSGLGGFLRRPVVLLVLALLVLAALMSLLGRLAAPPEAKVRLLSKEAGTETFASFSPDGKQLAYSGRASGRNETFHIFVRPVAGGAARQLTSGPADDTGPAWSPDGANLAFTRTVGERMQVAILPAAGGGERMVCEFPAGEAAPMPAVAWTGDGASLVVSARSRRDVQVLYRVPAGGGAPEAITVPPVTSDGDYLPAISPDGKTLAFARRNAADGSDVWLSDPTGASQRRLTYDDRQLRGLAWTVDGREILFSSNRGDHWALWRVPAAGGSPRDYLAAGRRAQYPAVAPKGGRMAFSDSPGVAAIWRAEIADPANERAIVRPNGRAASPSYSPDGKRIAYVAEEASEEIWVADSDGSNATRLTNFRSRRMGRPKWSPDGTKLVFDTREMERADLWTVAVAGGKPVQLTRMGAIAPSWSRDGKWVYYGMRQIWRIPAEGGKPEPLTPMGGAHPVESPDGKWVYYTRAREIWRIPVAGGEGEMVYSPHRNLVWGALVPAPDGVYYMEWDFRGRRATVLFYGFEEKAARTVAAIARADFDRGASFDISPDRKWVVYPKMDQSETNLQVVEGFR